MNLLDSQNSFKPPIAVNFIWNPADAGKVTPILDELRTSFARSKDRPFSRSLNLPLFYFSSENSNETPTNSPEALAESNIIFVFTSVNTLGRKNWREYIEGLSTSPFMNIVPIALDTNGLNHCGSLSDLNCIRAYDWPSANNELHAIVSLAHEIYRWGCVSVDDKDAGKKSSITIFLSHAKAGDTGRLHSEDIKRFIDNTNMNRFFDATEITCGFDFKQEIQNYIPGSTLLAIVTDKYSSRYWCQCEVLSAKLHNRPVVVLNCLDDFEDRIFPAVSNVPCVHVSAGTPISERDILRVISATIIETIRYCHSMRCLEKYKSEDWIEKDCELSARPPEIRQVLEWKEKGKTKICYPEPPIYFEEGDWIEKLDMDARTPLWSISERGNLLKVSAGISISEVKGDGFSSNHIHPDHLIRLAQDLARHLLARSATLLYGGDLRPDGFTEFILDEASILKDRIRGTQPHVENHLAWPLYVSDQKIAAWRSKFSKVMDTVEYDMPEDVSSGISKHVFLKPNNPPNKYIWSRCLTEMREKSISRSTVRICAGGKISGYNGKMPGVLEEVILALNAEKPVFLLGAFGGVVGDVCKIILYDEIPDSLTENWQIFHNEDYSDLQKIARLKGHHCDYDSVVNTLKRFNVSELSTRVGLTELEYKRLMLSPFIDECTYLILKGLKKAFNNH